MSGCAKLWGGKEELGNSISIHALEPSCGISFSLPFLAPFPLHWAGLGSAGRHSSFRPFSSGLLTWSLELSHYHNPETGNTTKLLASGKGEESAWASSKPLHWQIHMLPSDPQFAYRDNTWLYNFLSYSYPGKPHHCTGWKKNTSFFCFELTQYQFQRTENLVLWKRRNALSSSFTSSIIFINLDHVPLP